MFVKTHNAKTVVIDKATWRLWTETGAAGKIGLWSETAIKIAVENVNRGALLLDDKKPAWVAGILPEDLDMSNSSWCIIGQAYGDYGTQVGVPFGIPTWGSEDRTPDDDTREEELAFEHGFVTSDDFEDNPDFVPFPLLDRVWVYLLHARHELKTPVILCLPDLN